MLYFLDELVLHTAKYCEISLSNELNSKKKNNFTQIIKKYDWITIFQNLSPDFSTSLVISYSAILCGCTVTAVGFFCQKKNAQNREFINLKTSHLIFSLLPILQFHLSCVSL